MLVNRKVCFTIGRFPTSSTDGRSVIVGESNIARDTPCRRKSREYACHKPRTTAISPPPAPCFISSTYTPKFHQPTPNRLQGPSTSDCEETAPGLAAKYKSGTKRDVLLLQNLLQNDSLPRLPVDESVLYKELTHLQQQRCWFQMTELRDKELMNIIERHTTYCWWYFCLSVPWYCYSWGPGRGRCLQLWPYVILCGLQ